jgi:hypothetical protein
MAFAGVFRVINANLVTVEAHFYNEVLNATASLDTTSV